MFFSGRTKKDYGSSKRGNDDQEDLLAKLAAERLERQQKRNTERLVVLVQSVCRRNSAVRAARAMFREHFDKHVAAALSSRDAALSDRLVREFAFFAQGSSEDSTDSKRLVLVAALLRERTEAPLSLARPVSTLMAREVLPLSVAGAACKLLLLAMSGRIPDGWKAARFVFENLAKCFSLYPSLQTMFVAIASAPVQRAAWLRPLFVRHVLVVRNVLTNLPPQMLPNVVAAIGDIDGLTNDQALGVVGNLAFLVAGNHFNSRVVSALGSVLPTVVNQIFPFAAMLDRQSEDSDDDNDDNDEDQPKALAVPDDVLLVQNQLLLLTSSKTARLLLSSGLNHLTGICAVYALLLKFVPVQDSDRVRNLVFQSPDILVSLWSLLTCDDAHIQAFVAGSPQPTGFSSVLFIFCELYCRLLAIQTDEAFAQGPMAAHRAKLVQLLRPFVARLYISSSFGSFRHAIALLQRLYERNCRGTPFVPPEAWLAPEIDVTSMQRDLAGARLSRTAERILAECPFFIEFLDRVQLLRQIFRNEGGLDELGHGLHGVRVQIRRAHLVEDGLTVFRQLKADGRLKERLRITFINKEGLEEAGVDGGGVYKEFLNQLVSTAFKDHKLFLETDQHKLYPSACTDAASLEMYEFLGMVLGKALFENQLVDVSLAPFFLSKLLGRTSSFSELQTLDAELYRSLVFLLKAPTVADLGITWAVSERGRDGKVFERELVPNGASIPVTDENRIHYVYVLANSKLNADIRLQSKAFVKGMSRIVKMFALQMFNAAELQMLISGEDGPLDLEAWARATHYAGGYHPSQPVIRDFWSVVKEFTPQQQRKLLRFITSSSRAPLLGFESFYPPITISKRDGGDEYLPTAATCVNLLKMPEYSSKWIMRERLLYAIESNEGFELS